MEITNRTEKRIYELVLQRIYITPERYCLLTNVEIGKILDVSPITVRDKIIKLRKK